MKKVTEIDEDLGIINKIMKETPLYIRLKVLLQMNDIENWENGEYKGKAHLVVKDIMDSVTQWVKDGMPV